MARVKFVLNERRLALIDARRRAPAATNAKTADESLAGPLYEEEVVPKGA